MNYKALPISRHLTGTKKAFTLIEMLVMLFVFSVITITFYSVFSQGTSHILESKNRLGAVSLANQKMEMIRNLPYYNIGVVSGIPSGPIDPDEYEIINGRTYHVLTDVQYQDDAFDGTLGGDPDDTIPNDYKIARVAVRWGQESDSQEVFLVSTFVPPGMEEVAGGGTLAINANDSEGQGVPSVSVYLVNSETGIDINTSTDSDGHLLLPGTPAASLNTYEITLSKNGYETVSTMPLYPTSPYHPIEVHASVSEGELTQKDMTIDPLSEIDLVTVDPLGNAIADIEFKLEGGKILGTEDGTGNPVYNYDQNSTSDTEGMVGIKDVSPGTYQFTLQGTSDTNYKLFKMDPGDDLDEDSFSISGGISADINAIIADKSVPSLIVIVKDDTGSGIEDASVNLVNISLSYDVTLIADKYGKVYFPDASEALQNDNYDLFVSADGFNDNDSTVTISDLTEEIIELIPN